MIALCLPLVLGLGLGSLMQDGGTQPSSGTLFLHAERLPLADGGYVTVERGMLLTPLVRANPESRIIGVEVYRFPAAEGADPSTPPVVQLHGGPGWPGFRDQLEQPGGYERTILPMTEVSDLIVVGQRGIGSSKPNTLCDTVPAFSDGATQEEIDDSLRAACSDCRSFWEARGYDLRGFNVIEAAADVDDVRRLLGYDQVTISGGSFGSHWGMAVMRYHPEGVARAVLTGMEGPDHTYDMPSGVLASLERMAGDAEISSVLIEHVPEEGLIEAFKAVIADLEQEPVEVEVRHPRSGTPTTVRLDADDIRSMALGYSGRTSSRQGARTWPADVIALHRGEFELAARAKLERSGPDDLPTASFFMLDCGSGISPGRLKELQNDPAIAVVGDLGHWYETACSAWGADVGDDFRRGFVTQIPTVIVHGTWDTSTPFDNALELLDSFEDAHFVIVDGGSHGALREAMDHSNEFHEALMTFVATGDRAGLPEEIRLPENGWARPHQSP